MFYVYVLVSLKDKGFYIGITDNLEKRLRKHQAGGVPSTKSRRPLKLVYHEKYETRIEARKREKFLKSGPGHRFLAEILGSEIVGSRRVPTRPESLRGRSG